MNNFGDGISDRISHRSDRRSRRASSDSLPLVVGIIATLVLGKWIAATVVGRAFGYTPAARLTTWALTLPQVAATLAATLVAYHTVNADGQRMLDERMLNAVLVLMLVTSILGPVLTERFAPRMLDAEAREKESSAKIVIYGRRIIVDFESDLVKMRGASPTHSLCARGRDSSCPNYINSQYRSP